MLSVARSQQRAREAANPVAALNELAQRFVATGADVAGAHVLRHGRAHRAVRRVEGPGQRAGGSCCVVTSCTSSTASAKRRCWRARSWPGAGCSSTTGCSATCFSSRDGVQEANDAYQKMIDLKPYYHSYTRAAHLRWIKGDLPGAVELIEMAIKAASPRDPESIAWAYSRLAAYELQAGRSDGRAARGGRRAALSVRLRRGAARSAAARCCRTASRPRRSTRCRRAAVVSPLPEHEWALADGLRAMGHLDEARVVEDRLHRSGADAPIRARLRCTSRRGANASTRPSRWPGRS